jgi:hypothetical protein
MASECSKKEMASEFQGVTCSNFRHNTKMGSLQQQKLRWYPSHWDNFLS